ncbi:MAG: tetratricopeptide repeat protein [Candidatus Thorarchaeota archaeon]
MENPNTEKPYEKLSNLERALDNAKNSGNTPKILENLLKLGELCYDINANELGLKYVQEAIELSEKDSQYLHEFYKYLGDFNYELGMLDDAYKAYNNSIKLASKKRFYRVLAESYFRLGRLNHVQEKIKQAISHFKKAEKIYEEMGLPIEQAKLYNKIGLMYTNKISETPEETKLDRILFGPSIGIGPQGSLSYSKAKKYFKKAKAIIEEHNLVEEESVLYRSILTNLNTKFKDFK